MFAFILALFCPRALVDYLAGDADQAEKEGR